MQYCERCQRLLPPEATTCHGCKGRTDLRAPKENDPVLLLVAPSFVAQIVEPLLADYQIPHIKIGKRGVGFTMIAGPLNEEYIFQVPYGAYGRALELLESAFGEDEQIMASLKSAQEQQDA